MRRIPSFVWGHVVGAFVVGGVCGAFLDLTAVVTFSSVLAGGAAISALVCGWWPKFDAVGWKLWLAATFANPLLLASVIWSVAYRECLLEGKAGWDCMFADIGLLAGTASLPSPLIGLLMRWWSSTRQNRF